MKQNNELASKFGLHVVNDKELPTLIKVIDEENKGDKEKTLKDLHLIDQGLTIMRNKSLMLKRLPRVKQQLEALIKSHLTGKQPMWDSRRKRYNF